MTSERMILSFREQAMAAISILKGQPNSRVAIKKLRLLLSFLRFLEAMR